jgi:hypothetical protein
MRNPELARAGDQTKFAAILQQNRQAVREQPAVVGTVEDARDG